MITHQGHPRSMIFVSIESAYISETSDRWHIVVKFEVYELHFLLKLYEPLCALRAVRAMRTLRTLRALRALRWIETPLNSNQLALSLIRAGSVLVF